MEAKTTGERNVALRFVTVAAGPGDGYLLACLNCGRSLDIHQPDPDLPERLLATCATCNSWHLVECASDGSTAVVVALPDSALFRGHPSNDPCPGPLTS